MEASIEGIDSIGFSYLDFSFEADFTSAKFYAEKIMKYTLENGLGNTKLLNVNVPKLPLDQIHGMKICRQAEGNWTEEFKEAKDPRGETYYWMTGEFKLETSDEDTDIWALGNGYVSIVPSMHDLTAHTAIDSLKTLESK